MENLLITQEESEFFYENGEKLDFLGDIRDINLFIGANNTRKSRLMRAIAKMPFKISVTSPSNFNTLHKKGLALLERIKVASSKNPDTVLVEYRSKRYALEKTKRFSLVQEFFGKEVAPLIRYGTFSAHLENILETISNAVEHRQKIQLVSQDIERLYSLVDLLNYVYECVGKGYDVTYNNDHFTWDENNANAIDFLIPDRSPGGEINEFEDKAELVLDLRSYLYRLKKIEFKEANVKSIYIPVLRSSRNLLTEDNKLVGRGLFKSTINYQYFGSKDSPENITVHTGQEHYDLIDKAKRGKKDKRMDFREFENFIGRSFYQSPEIEIIAHNEGDNPEIIVSLPGERPDVAIFDLGDGVQAIINLFFPIFTANEGSWIFIDEPELNLHPGFQNLFIRTLMENDFLRKKKLRYFINSHSNHVLSETLLSGADKSEVFVFHRRDADSSTVRPFTGFENATLDMLGVMNTSTLISNCSIWVEGVTDRLYLRAFLTAYLKIRVNFQPIEGLNYSFIEYGGKNLVHYIFDESLSSDGASGKINAFLINNRIFLLADTDTKKDQQHAAYRAKDSDRFHYEETVAIEIENTIPKEILSAFLCEKLKLSKNEAQQILSKPYRDVKLGKFLDEGLKSIGKEIKIASEKGATLSSYYKSSLAEFVLHQVQNGRFEYSVLSESEDIKRITDNLFEFIAISNNRADALPPF